MECKGQRFHGVRLSTCPEGGCRAVTVKGGDHAFMHAAMSCVHLRACAHTRAHTHTHTHTHKMLQTGSASQGSTMQSRGRGRIRAVTHM
eukprot:1159932-Pelagomonas_calceolata.AAC.6